VIDIDSLVANFSYTKDQLRLLTAIGQLTGMAIENTRLYQENVHRERLAAAGETVASLSHSIKNILQGMRGGADVVELALKKNSLDDAKAGLSYLAEHYPGQAVTVCGFSFGARMGMEVGSNDERVKLLISIGTPLDKYDFSFLEQCRKPLLFVHGENDEFGDTYEVRSLAERLGQTIPVKFVVIPGTGHFFEGHLDELKSAIYDWVTAQLER